MLGAKEGVYSSAKCLAATHGASFKGEGQLAQVQY